MTLPEPDGQWDPRPLNQQFYSSDPAAYFRIRLHLLALVAGRGSDIDALLTEGVQYEDMLYKLEADEPGSEKSEAEEERLQRAYITTESQALLHHAAEALIRLFIAHADINECPWVECSRLTNFRDFKEKARLLAGTPDQTTRDQISRVFIGRPESGITDKDREGLEGSIRLLQVLADRLLKDSGIYNSVKHGMTVFPSEAYVSVGVPGGAVMLEGSGPSIAHLQYERRDGGIAWYEKTTWISFKQAVWLTELIISQISLLWGVAKHRYLNEPTTGLRIVKVEAVDLALKKMGQQGGMINFRRPLMFESG